MTPIQKIRHNKTKLYALLKEHDIAPIEFKPIFEAVNKYINILILNETACNKYLPMEVLESLGRNAEHDLQ